MRVAVSLPVPTDLGRDRRRVRTGRHGAHHRRSRLHARTRTLFDQRSRSQAHPACLPSASSTFWGARECLRLGIVDGVIPEPSGGAQTDPDGAAQQLRLTIVHALGRAQRHRAAPPARRTQPQAAPPRVWHRPPAAKHSRIEIAQLHEIQQSLGRSIDELRGRLELHQLGLPNLPSLPQVDLSSLPNRAVAPAGRSFRPSDAPRRFRRCAGSARTGADMSTSGRAIRRDPTRPGGTSAGRARDPGNARSIRREGAPSR